MTEINAAFSELVHISIEDTACDQHSPNRVFNWTFTRKLVDLMRRMKVERAYIAIIPGTYKTPEQIRASNGHLTEEQLIERRSHCAHEFVIEEGKDPVTCDNCKDLPLKACTCDDCRDGSFRYPYDDISIFPLDKQTGLVQLFRPGNFAITTALVISMSKKRFEKSEIKASVHCFAQRHDGHVLWKMDEGWCENHNIFPNPTYHSIQVTSKLFATPVAPWRLWWAELWLGKMKNSCQHFWSQLFTYPVQGPIIALWIALRTIIGLLIALWLLLTGWRHTSLIPLFHPFTTDVIGPGTSPEDHIDFSDIKARDSDTRNDPKGSFIQYTKKGVERSRLGKILYAPFFWIAMGIAYGIYHRWPKQTMRWSLVFIAAVIAIGLITLIVKTIIKRAEARPQKIKNQRINRHYERLLTKASVQQQTPNRITLTSRIIHTKAHSCLPFAR